MVKFDYTLQDHGWATIHARFDTAQLEFRVSYMSPALEDVVASTVALMAGETVTRFALIDEPGSYCWVLSRKSQALHILIVHLDSMYRTECYNKKMLPGQPPPEEEGEFVLSIECPIRDFVEAVAEMIRQINSQYTASDFTRTRNRPVPQRLVEELNRLLGR